MFKFVETLIYAIKTWVHSLEPTADDALDLSIEMKIVEPLADKQGTIYTSPSGVIYTL